MREKRIQIEGKQTPYLVRDDGTIWSEKRNRVLKGTIERNEYHTVYLSFNNRQYNFMIHRLVAEAFCPNPNNYTIVHHKDENKQNNCVDNLEWCTQYENVHKYFDTKPEKYNKSKKSIKKIKNYHLSRKILQLDKNGIILNIWNSMMDIERNLGIKSGNISLCCRGIKPTAKGYIWRYADKQHIFIFDYSYFS